MAISLQKLCMLFISFFFVFSPRPGLSFPVSTKCRPDESDALLRIKASFNDPLGYLSSWVNGTDCCTNWTGISCDNHTNHVVSLSLVFPAGVILRLLRSLDIEFVSGTTTLPLLLSGIIPPSLCLLTRLTQLVLSDNQFNGSIPSCLGNLSSLTELDLGGNQLSGSIPDSLGSLSSLTELDLGGNQFNGSIPPCLGNLSSLTRLELTGNQLSGSIPASLGNLSSLSFLGLSWNEFSGSIPDFLGSLSSLNELYLDGNQLNGIIPHSLGNLSLLKVLAISDNNLTGTIPPSFARLSSLTEFSADGNHFNETIFPSSFPASLNDLSLSLKQSVPETFFDNLTNLQNLYLSDCMLNISKTWIPPFQLSDLELVSCMIEDEVSPWLSTQFSLEWLVLVNTGLVGQIPSWLCENSPMLSALNLSANHLEGSLLLNSSICMHLEILDVSRNKLSGPIPSIWYPNLTTLILRDNFFTGNIPVSLSKCSLLGVLNLGNNSLEGSLPHEFSQLSELYSLVVHNNKLKGSLPSSIANCSKLRVLDVGNNLFEGEIPTSLKNISILEVLVMKGNNFTGSIPPELGQLTKLQILLLSSNHFSGLIPPTIVLLQAMMIEGQDGHQLSSATITTAGSYHESIDMTSKGTDRHYPYVLSTLTCIDLSNNKLEGEIAFDFGKLKGLRLLNLSMNNLNGTIPNSLGEMSQLEQLDLSRNHFSGQIPVELESLNFLGSLDLSNNNLSGSIPQGRHITTFEKSCFSGNPNLWGCPLPKNCSWPDFVASPPVSINKGKKIIEYPWYKIAVGLSYGAAFGGLISLIVIKINWRRKYFNKVDTILKFLFPWMKNLTV